MSSLKTLNEWGIQSIVEVTYGTFVVPSDGFLAIEMPDPTLDYIHDGSRGQNPSGGQLSGVGRAGRGGALSVSSQMILPQVAYSASLKPSLDLWLRAAGFELTTDFTPSSESYTYDPENSGFESASIRTFKEGQQFDLAGAYNTFSIGAEGPEVPTWEFEHQGIGVLPIDLALPAITYINAALEPPKSLGAGLLVIGGYGTAILRSWEFILNREMSPRADDNSAGGHAGFTPGNTDPKLTVTIEADALATFNPYTDSEAATSLAVVLQIGTSQFDRWKIRLPQAEITDVVEAEDGATALWEIELSGKASAIGLNDGVQFVAD